MGHRISPPQKAFEYFLQVGLKITDTDLMLELIDSQIQKQNQPNNNNMRQQQIPIQSIYPQQQQKQTPAFLSNIDKWCFPNGFELILEKDPLFQKIDNFYNSEDDKSIMTISQMNYFVITDLKSAKKYYCASANIYDKIYLPKKEKDQNEEETFIKTYVPKSYCLISNIPLFIVQKQILCQLLQVFKMKINQKYDKIIEIQKEDKYYAIEQSRLQDFYIEQAFENTLIQNDNLNCIISIDPNNLQNNQQNITQNNNELLWYQYWTRNNEYKPLQNIMSPSNNAFDAVIFNQSPYNLYKLQLYLLQEYQIIFLTRRSAYATIFANNLIELLRPLTWKGAFLPYLIKNTFDYEYTTIPYIVGLDKSKFIVPEQFRDGVKKRVIYDLDEAKFVLQTGKPECPKQYQNFLIKKINDQISELKFWEEDYYDEAVLKYRQCFYNFQLLLFHDLLHYFSRTQTTKLNQPKNKGKENIDSTTPKSLKGLTNNNNFAQKQDEEQDTTKASSNKLQQRNKKVAYFNYKAYLKSFKREDRPFFDGLTRTQMFTQFIKECFKAIDYKQDYIDQMKTKQKDFDFPSIFQFIKDVRTLAQQPISCNKKDGETLIEQQFSLIEQQQNQAIQEILQQKSFPTLKINIYNNLPQYLEKIQKHSDSTDFSSSLDNIENIIDDEEEIVKINPVQNLNQDIIIQEATPLPTTHSDSPKQVKNILQHLKLFDKRYALANRLLTDNQAYKYANNITIINNNTNINYSQNQELNSPKSINNRSDKASTLFEIHSAYSQNFGKYLPLKRASSKSISNKDNFNNISFNIQQQQNQNQNNLSQNRNYYNKSFNSLWANFGEISESQNEHDNLENNNNNEIRPQRNNTYILKQIYQQSDLEQIKEQV